MNIVLLSGGSGKRLWPLSSDVRSKQFLELFKRNDGSRESMLQRMYNMLREVDNSARVTIATSEKQVAYIKKQLGNDVSISIEPCRRDTFPAIALATAYLHDVQNVKSDDAVVICPVDPYAELDYYNMLNNLYMQALKNEANLVLMGIKPTYPSEKYDYIIPKSLNRISEVECFIEKPDIERAKKYIKQGALWNSGVFAYRLGYVLDISKRIFGTSDYKYMYENYNLFSKISFDYEVAEKEKKIQVMLFSGIWKDLGTWDALTSIIDEKIIGNAVIEKCENTHIINELDIPIVGLGVKDLAIVATSEGILVINKKDSDKLKKCVDSIL